MTPEENLQELLQIECPGASSTLGASPRRDDLLDRLRVASPCEASWAEMEGDDLVRFCRHCEKHVYNLSAMSRDGANEFLQATEAQACVRFYRRHDGTVLTEDCPVGWRATRRRLLKWMGGVAAGVFAIVGVKPPAIYPGWTGGGFMGLYDASSIPLYPEHAIPPQSVVGIGAVIAALAALVRRDRSRKRKQRATDRESPAGGHEEPG